MLPEGYRQLQILIVDDMAQTRRLLRSVLTHVGIREISEADSRADAFAQICLINPDIVITDWEMPGGSGLDLIRDIRFDPRSPDQTMPVILLTSHGSREVVTQGRDAGATDFLVKPFTPAAVMARLRDVVDQQRSNIITSSYRGPDRRRTARDVVVDRRKGGGAQGTVLAPDGLLKAKVSSDTASIREAHARRVQAMASFAGATSAATQNSVLDSFSGKALVQLVDLALTTDDIWPEVFVCMAAPLQDLLDDPDDLMQPALRRSALAFQAFMTNEHTLQDAPRVRQMLQSMQLILNTRLTSVE